MGKGWIRRLVVLITAVMFAAASAPPVMASHGGVATPTQFGTALSPAEQAVWIAVVGNPIAAAEQWAHQHNRTIVSVNGSTCATSGAEETFKAVFGLGLGCAMWLVESGGVAKASVAPSATVSQEEAAKGGSCGQAEQRIFRNPTSAQVRGLAILELNRDGENEVDGGGDAYALLPRGQVVWLNNVMGSVWEYPSDCSTVEVEGQYNLGLKISPKRVQRSLDALVQAGWVRR